MEKKIKRVMWGRQEHPLTVFVPWDCGHHCPFCTTKGEYESLYPPERIDENFERLKESMRRMIEYGFVNEVVFTGGEPLADVGRLEELIALAKDCNVYINTSLDLPPTQAEMAIRFLVREFIKPDNLLDGISVSLPFAEATGANIARYRTLCNLCDQLDHSISNNAPYNWCRVNSVVRGTETPDQIRTFLKDLSRVGNEKRKLWHIWSVNLRKDYSYCGQENLNDCFDPTMRMLMSMPDLRYLGHGGCLVCRNDVFEPRMAQGECRICMLTYHRGVERTSLRYGDNLVINDFVIKPDGEIRYDWNQGTRLPKRVMDTLAPMGRSAQANEAEWKWENPLFARRLAISGIAGERSCRDRSFERCG